MLKWCSIRHSMLCAAYTCTLLICCTAYWWWFNPTSSCRALQSSTRKVFEIL